MTAKSLAQGKLKVSAFANFGVPILSIKLHLVEFVQVLQLSGHSLEHQLADKQVLSLGHVEKSKALRKCCQFQPFPVCRIHLRRMAHLGRQKLWPDPVHCFVLYGFCCRHNFPMCRPDAHVVQLGQIHLLFAF